MTQLIKNASTRITTLWRLIAKDGTSLSVTSGTRAITLDGVTYAPAALHPSQQQLIENLDPSNLEIVVPLVPGGLTKQDLENGRWNAARLEIRVYDYETQTVERTWIGILSAVDTNNGRMKAETLDLAVLLNQPIGDLYQEECRASYGDAQCGAQPYISSVTVTSVVSRKEFLVSLALPEAKYFDYGICRFTSAANSNLRKEIKSAVQEDTHVRVVLVDAVRNEIAAGDTVDLIEGCDGKFETCIKKNNARRFRGEPRLPGIYKLLQFPS